MIHCAQLMHLAVDESSIIFCELHRSGPISLLLPRRGKVVFVINQSAHKECVIITVCIHGIFIPRLIIRT